MINVFHWVCDTSHLQPTFIQIMRGETVRIDCEMRNYSADVDLSGATAMAYWRSDDMPADEYYRDVDGVTISGGKVSWTWDENHDAGACLYDFWIGIDGVDGATFRPFGRIQMVNSPAGDPSVVPIPSTTLDFSRYTVVNAPFYTKEEEDAKFLAKTEAEETYLPKTGGTVDHLTSQGDIRAAGGTILLSDEDGPSVAIGNVALNEYGMTIGNLSYGGSGILTLGLGGGGKLIIPPTTTDKTVATTSDLAGYATTAYVDNIVGNILTQLEGI